MILQEPRKGAKVTVWAFMKDERLVYSHDDKLKDAIARKLPGVHVEWLYKSEVLYDNLGDPSAMALRVDVSDLLDSSMDDFVLYASDERSYDYVDAVASVVGNPCFGINVTVVKGPVE